MCRSSILSSPTCITVFSLYCTVQSLYYQWQSFQYNQELNLFTQTPWFEKRPYKARKWPCFKTHVLQGKKRDKFWKNTITLKCSEPKTVSTYVDDSGRAHIQSTYNSGQWSKKWWVMHAKWWVESWIYNAQIYKKSYDTVMLALFVPESFRPFKNTTVIPSTFCEQCIIGRIIYLPYAPRRVGTSLSQLRHNHLKKLIAWI